MSKNIMSNNTTSTAESKAKAPTLASTRINSSTSVEDTIYSLNCPTYTNGPKFLSSEYVKNSQVSSGTKWSSSNNVAIKMTCQLMGDIDDVKSPKEFSPSQRCDTSYYNSETDSDGEETPLANTKSSRKYSDPAYWYLYDASLTMGDVLNHGVL
jgi:hypothetical protein